MNDSVCQVCNRRMPVRRVIGRDGNPQLACYVCEPPSSAPEPVKFTPPIGRGWENVFRIIGSPPPRDVENQTYIPGFEPPPAPQGSKKGRQNHRQEPTLWTES